MDKVKYEKTKAHQRYKTSDGATVPGVTTALGIINKPQLLAWAWKCGCDGIDYRKTSGQAADIGSIAHWLVECHLKGQTPDTSEFAPADLAKAENAYIKFLSWWDKSGLRYVASEMQLVSELERYGGTLDIMAEGRDGEKVLVDLKTSKAIYTPEMTMQLAAYANLYHEVHGEQVKRYIICRIGKENEGDFEVREWTDLNAELDGFRAALALHKIMQTLKKGN